MIINGVKLTDREEEIALLMAEGLTNYEIAEAVSLTHGTVQRHLAEIRRKVGCERRIELARLVWEAQHES